MGGVKFDRGWKSQKTIVTVQFTTLTLSRVRSFVKIEALFVLHPKLWPNRWQMPTLAGVNIDRRQELQKPIVTIEFTTLDLCRVQNFIKIEAFVVLRSKLCPERWQVPTLAVKNYRKLLSSMNSATSNCLLCKILWKMVNLIPHSPSSVSHSRFPVSLFKDSHEHLTTF